VTTVAVASIAAIIPMILMVRMFFAPVAPTRAIGVMPGQTGSCNRTDASRAT
jgi:hypothetical protein